MTPRQKHAHCSYCGSPFADDVWPRTCAPCGNISYVNPLPVVVALVPVDGGLLCIRRTIEPRIGELALPGGFLEVGESWQEGCARELLEETGVVVMADEVRLFAVHSATKIGRPTESVLLVFGLVGERRAGELSAFAANEETSEMVVIREPVELAFPLHTRAVRDYFQGRATG
jgi:ADP-ribose pyrophosphatase YjhB (NUDIX family)